MAAHHVGAYINGNIGALARLNFPVHPKTKAINGNIHQRARRSYTKGNGILFQLGGRFGSSRLHATVPDIDPRDIGLERNVLGLNLLNSQFDK